MGGKSPDEETGSAEVIMPDGFGSSFSTKEIRAKVNTIGKEARCEVS